MNPIPKHKVDTPSGRFEIALTGTGTPTVVLINGGGGPIEGWFRVMPELARSTSVLAYNRLGMGGSDKPAVPQHGKAIAKALAQLLKAADIPPPYVLVGHSLGGLYANLYARLYPSEIAGVVFVEASHPSDLRLNETQGAFVRGINRLLGFYDSLFPARRWKETLYVEETARQIAEAGSFPDVPVFVVSGGKKPPFMPEHAFRIRQENQRELAGLSSRSSHRIIEGSGHFPQLTAPSVVIEAVLACLNDARTPAKQS